MKNEWNKGKNHFCEMKGDVGMSVHKLIHNPIPTSLFLSRPQNILCPQFDVKMFSLPNKQNKDVGMGL